MTTERYEPKKFAVIGAGPAGGVLAAYLAAGGCEVTLCDLQPGLLGPAEDPGIRIEGTETFQARVARTTTRIEDLVEGSPEVIFVAVKATALPLIASALEGFGGEGRFVISWQNGLDTERILAEHLGDARVLRAIVNFGCVTLGPAHFRLVFHHRPHFLQELDPEAREAAIGICEVLTRCGLETVRTERIADMSWRKAVLNACMNPICAITGKTMAEVINDPILFNLVDALIKEGISVARANEYTLGPDFYPYCIGYIRGAGHHKPSMLQDIEAGRRTEIDFINGKIVEYGVQAGVATPCNTMVRGLVKALEPG